jgi:hypothetical protein
MADEELKQDDAVSSPAEDEVVVKAEDDDPSNDDNLSPEEGIEDLKRNYEELKQAAERDRQARLEAERAAYEAQVAAQNDRMNAAAANYQSIKDGISFLKGRESQVLEAWKEAKSLGDYSREADLQREMYGMQQTLERLEGKKAQFENFFQRPPEPVAPPQPIDPVEAFAQQQTPATAAWVRRNRDFIADETNKHLIASAHHRALADGYEKDTPAYFRAIEEEIGIRKPSRRVERDEDDEDYDRRPSARRSAPPPAAPVSRGGTRKGAVTLNAAERDAAEVSGLSYEEYYRQQQKIKNEQRQGGRR